MKFKKVSQFMVNYRNKLTFINNPVPSQSPPDKGGLGG